MKITKTSFGSLEPLLIRDGKVVTELATFHSEGKSHIHDQWEICYVLKGRGIIVVGDNKYDVGAGNIISIPPKDKHYMIPSLNNDSDWEILLVYVEHESAVE